jgi:hypothetical protein
MHDPDRFQALFFPFVGQRDVPVPVAGGGYSESRIAGSVRSTE